MRTLIQPLADGRPYLVRVGRFQLTCTGHDAELWAVRCRCGAAMRRNPGGKMWLCPEGHRFKPMIATRIRTGKLDPKKELARMMRKGVALVLFLAAVCWAQPAVRVEQTGTALGSFQQGAAYSVVRTGDLYSINVKAMRNVTAITATIARPFVATHYPEHLGMRCEWNRAPEGYTTWPNDHPGLLQGAWIIGHELNKATLLAALDAPVKVAGTASTITLRWEPNLPAGQAATFRYVYMEDPAAGSERQRSERLMAALKMLSRFECAVPPELQKTAGALAFMAQDHADARAALLAARPDAALLGGLILWGPTAAQGGSCCDARLGWHDRLEATVKELAPQLRLWSYARPDPDQDAEVFLPFAVTWWRWLEGQGIGTYLDTAGYRDMRPKALPAPVAAYLFEHIEPPATLITEGVLPSWNRPALIGNAYTGGGFPFGAGALPLTLPDGTPEPRSTKPWITSAPYCGSVLWNDGFLLAGGNTDEYWSGRYTTPDGRAWDEALPRKAFVLNHRLCPRKVTALYRDILTLRRNLASEGSWRYLGTGGLDAIPVGVQATVLLHNSTGKRVLAVDITDLKAAPWTLTYRGLAVAKPAKPLSYVEVP